MLYIRDPWALVGEGGVTLVISLICFAHRVDVVGRAADAFNELIVFIKADMRNLIHVPVEAPEGQSVPSHRRCKIHLHCYIFV